MLLLDIIATIVAGLCVVVLLSRRFAGWGNWYGAASNSLLAFVFVWLALRTWDVFS